MCCRLTNRRYCLLVGTLVGVAQLLVATPIMVLSLIVLLSSELGHVLSPYWAASLVSSLTELLHVVMSSPRRGVNSDYDVTRLHPKHSPVMCMFTDRIVKYGNN